MFRKKMEEGENFARRWNERNTESEQKIFSFCVTRGGGDKSVRTKNIYMYAI